MALLALMAQVVSMKTYLDIAREVLAEQSIVAVAVETTAPQGTQKAGVESQAEPESSRSERPIVSESAVEYRKGLESQQRSKMAHRLTGNDFPPIPPTVPDTRILATPKALCSCCGKLPVLAELRGLTGGRCYQCSIAAKEI